MNDVKRYVNTSGHSTRVACNFLAVVWSSRIWGKCREAAEPGGRLEEARGPRAPSGLIHPGGDSPKAHAWSPPSRVVSTQPALSSRCAGGTKGPANQRKRTPPPPPSLCPDPAGAGVPEVPSPHPGEAGVLGSHPLPTPRTIPHRLHSPRKSRMLLHRTLGAEPGGTELVPSACERDRDGLVEEGKGGGDTHAGRRPGQTAREARVGPRSRNEPSLQEKRGWRSDGPVPRPHLKPGPGRQSEPCPPGRHRSPSERGPGRLERGTSRFSVSFSDKSRDAWEGRVEPGGFAVCTSAPSYQECASKLGARAAHPRASVWRNLRFSEQHQKR